MAAESRAGSPSPMLTRLWPPHLRFPYFMETCFHLLRPHPNTGNLLPMMAMMPKIGTLQEIVVNAINVTGIIVI